jgi:hypothetical protein
MNNREMFVRVLEALRWPLAWVIIIALLREPISTVVHSITGMPVVETSRTASVEPKTR